MPNVDGLYLCNSPQKRSAVAYYSNIAQEIHPPIPQPDDLVYVSDGQDRVWEGDWQSATFPSSGVTFAWFISANAQDQPPGSLCGTASNGSENFSVYLVPNDNIIFVTDNDGVQLQAIYFAQ